MESGNWAGPEKLQEWMLVFYNVPLSNFIPSGLIFWIEKMSSKTMLDVNEAMGKTKGCRASVI
jgi:hypothetical protein